MFVVSLSDPFTRVEKRQYAAPDMLKILLPSCYCVLHIMYAVLDIMYHVYVLLFPSMRQLVYMCCLQVKRDIGVSLAGPGRGLRSLGVPGGGGMIYRGRVVGVTAVVALALIFPDRGETVPPLFQKVICYIDTPIQSVCVCNN